MDLLHKLRQLFNSSQLVELLELLLDLTHLRVLLAEARVLVLQILLEALKLHLETRLDQLFILTDLVDCLFCSHARNDLLASLNLFLHDVEFVHEQVFIHFYAHFTMLKRFLKSFSLNFVFFAIFGPDPVFNCLDLIVKLLRRYSIF